MQETALSFPIRKRFNIYAEFPTYTTIDCFYLSQSIFPFCEAGIKPLASCNRNYTLPDTNCSQPVPSLWAPQMTIQP